MTLDFATYSDTLNYWVYVHLLFEYSISDQVIFSKSFQQFRTDIYETPQEKTYMYLDIIRILFLVTVAVFHIVESVYDACKTKCTLKAVMRSLLYLTCLVLFVIEGAFIAMQTPTSEVLEQQNGVIDFSELVYKY